MLIPLLERIINKKNNQKNARKIYQMLLKEQKQNESVHTLRHNLN